MRHRKGIDLIAPIPPAKHYEYKQSGGIYETVGGLREWEVLGAKCAKCSHVAWLDKKAVERRIGNHYLINVGAKLVCRCGNAKDNIVLVGTLGRD